MAQTTPSAAGRHAVHDERHTGGHGHTHLPAGPHATESADGLRVVSIATGGMLVVALIEFGIFAISGSAGLLSDALHNFGDVLTTVALFAAFLVARRPATRRYTYGFHRAEDLAGAFISLVIVVSAGAAAYESYIRLIHNDTPTQIPLSIFAALIGFAGNEALAEYKIRAGRRINSQALIADGQHSRADGITSLAAALGLLLTAFGVRQADPVAGLLISVAILYILVDVGREVFYRLMDAVEPAVVEQIRGIAQATPGVQDVQDIRARWSGRRLYIAMNIGADASITLAEADAIAERVRQETLAHVTGAALVDIHVDPLGLPSGADPHAWLHDHAAHDHAHDDEDHGHHENDHDHAHDDHAHDDAAHEHTHEPVGGEPVSG